MKSLNKLPLILVISFTKTNILCTITNIHGKTLMWVNAGVNKVKGTKKITTSTILTLVKNIQNFCEIHKHSFIHLKIKGINKIKFILIKQLTLSGLVILTFQEKLKIPFGGCKTSKSRKL